MREKRSKCVWPEKVTTGDDLWKRKCIECKKKSVYVSLRCPIKTSK